MKNQSPSHRSAGGSPANGLQPGNTRASRPRSNEPVHGKDRAGSAKFFALVFGFFLGLCIWKFGNPVILEQKISTPKSLPEFWGFAWPPEWANWVLLIFAVSGAVLIFRNKIARLRSKWLWLLPLAWLAWQFLSATQTVDAGLSAMTLWQFSGCAVCYFLGAFIFSRAKLRCWLFPGLLVAFTFCLIRGIDQRLFEFPVNYQMLIQGEHHGWTNFPPASIADMKSDKVIITTNGMEVANPAILKRFKEGRVSGTMVYPNALAGLILLLWPASLALAFGATKRLKPPIRFAVITLAIFLGGAAFFWSGSKLGWLLGLGVAGIYLLRLNWSKKLKITAVAFVIIFGLGVFAVRFHHYFARGATSVVARFDYWHAAVQTTLSKPVFGTGPGTFQRPYARLKSPKAEMARLTHNDYLEQFSDSGIIGGLAYVAWIVFALVFAVQRVWKRGDNISFALFVGLLAWFLQGVGEFGLYIQAPAWIAFTYLGCLIGPEINGFDKKSGAG